MNSPTNLTLMELPYIQDIVGDKKESPVAPFAKAKEKNIIACTRRIYRQDKLIQANFYDYQASDGKALCSEKLCTKHGETKYEYITDKNGRLLKIITTRSNGHQDSESHRKWLKQVTTFSNGYLTSIGEIQYVGFSITILCGNMAGVFPPPLLTIEHVLCHCILNLLIHITRTICYDRSKRVMLRESEMIL